MGKNRLFIPLGYRKNGQPIYRIAGGSEPAGQETGGQVPQGQQNVGTGQQQQPQQQQTGGKPYDQYLQRIPEGLRPVVTPIFDEWDSNVTKQFQQYTEQLKGYEPYQGVFDQYEPEAVQQAVGLAEQLSSREGAEQLFTQLASALGYEIDGQNASQPGGNNEGFENEDPAQNFFSDPRFQSLEEGLGTIAQTLQQQQEQAQMREIQQEVEKELTDLRTQHKDLLTGPDGKENEAALDIILNIAAQNGGDLEGAFNSYRQAVGQQATAMNQPGRNAPIVGGGAANSMPSNVTDPAKWNPQQRKEAALAIVRANNQQQG